jgi:hypothetical protein
MGSGSLIVNPFIFNMLNAEGNRGLGGEKSKFTLKKGKAQKFHIII